MIKAQLEKILDVENVSKIALSEALGINERTLRSKINGSSEFTTSQLIQLSMLLDIDLAKVCNAVMNSDAKDKALYDLIKPYFTDFNISFWESDTWCIEFKVCGQEFLEWLGQDGDSTKVEITDSQFRTNTDDLICEILQPKLCNLNLRDKLDFAYYDILQEAVDAILAKDKKLKAELKAFKK